jgi:GDPmannose 4,6-dehydratase
VEDVTKKKPSDYVISTGKQYSVKKFVELSLNELKIKYRWKGQGINTKCYDEKGNCIVACKKAYFRPLEVDTLLGDSRKARKELGWKPKTTITTLVKEMIQSEMKFFNENK